MNYDRQMGKQVQELNSYVLTKIQPSKIHGVGVFALRDIPKDMKVNADMMFRMYTLPLEYFDKLYPEVSELLLERWPQIVNGSRFIYPDTKIQAFMNHSDKPNYDATSDITLKKIKKGEEITEDYRQIEGWEKVFEWLVKK